MVGLVRIDSGDGAVDSVKVDRLGRPEYVSVAREDDEDEEGYVMYVSVEIGMTPPAVLALGETYSSRTGLREYAAYGS